MLPLHQEHDIRTCVWFTFVSKDIFPLFTNSFDLHTVHDHVYDQVHKDEHGLKIQLTWAGDRKDSEIVIWETCFLTHVTSAKRSTLESRQAKDDHPHFSYWETREAINRLQKITIQQVGGLRLYPGHQIPNSVLLPYSTLRGGFY